MVTESSNNIIIGDETELLQCILDDCKTENVIEAYHNYYREYKKDFVTWKNRRRPSWYDINQ